MRFLQLFCLAVVLAAGIVPSAAAFGFTDESLLPPNGLVGHSYSFKLNARNGCPPYMFLIDSGNLPPGLSMAPSGQISGTAAAAGTWSFWGDVTNVCHDHSERLISITIADTKPVRVPVPLGEVGRPFSAPITPTEGTAPYRWSVASGTLPAGLAIDSVQGTITGVPATAGRFPLGFAVSNDRGGLTPQALTVEVASRLAIATTKLARPIVGRAYAAKVTVRGGVGAVTWRVVRGALPRGIRIDRRSGALLGTARHAGTFRFTVAARDTLGAASTRTFTLVVHA